MPHSRLADGATIGLDGTAPDAALLAESARPLGQRVLGAGVTLAALVWCGVHGYFVLTHPQAFRPLTIPLVALVLALGAARWRWQVLLFIFLAPLLYWVPSMDGELRLRITGLLFPFVLLPWGLRLLVSSPPPPRVRLQGPLLLYVGLVVLSAVLTLSRYAPLTSVNTLRIFLSEIAEANRGSYWAYFRPEFCIANDLLVYTAGPLMLLLLLQTASREFRAQIRTVLIAGVTVAAIVAVQQKLTGAPTLPLEVQGREGLQRVHGTLGDPNTFGAYLVLLLPVVLCEGLRWWRQLETARFRKLRAAAFLPVLLVALALVSTASRAAWLGAMLALAVVGRGGWEMVRGHFPRLAVPVHRVVRWGTVLVVIAAAVFFIFARQHRENYAEWRSAVDVFLSFTNLAVLKHEITVRWSWWYPALAMGMLLPLTGVGIGNYRYFCNQYWPVDEYLSILGEPHNYYLKPFAELGVPGAALCAYIAWRVWRRAKQQDLQHLARADRLRRTAVVAGLLGLALDIVFQHALVQNEMQIITAAALSLLLTDEQILSPAATTTRIWSRVGLLAIPLLIAAIVWAGAYRYREPTVVPVDRPLLVEDDFNTSKGAGLPAVSFSLDFPLGRALLVVSARGEEVLGKWPSLELVANGDTHPRMTRMAPVNSESLQLYYWSVFTRQGRNDFELRVRDYLRDPGTNAERTVYVDYVGVLHGHEASRHLRRLGGPPHEELTAFFAALLAAHEVE